MATGARARTVLPMLPVAVSAVALVVFAVLVPDLTISALRRPVLIGLTGIVGTGCALLLAIAAGRAQGRPRFTWAALALASTLWTLALVGAQESWPQVTVWVGLRGGAFTAAALGLLASWGGRRTAREWGLLLLDGWLVGVSTFLVGWVGLGLTGSRPGAAMFAPLALFWLPSDLLLAGLTAGLAARVDVPERGRAGLIVVSSLLSVTGDTTLALTHHPQFGVVQWLIVLTALGCATLTGRSDVWAGIPADSSSVGLARPPLTRLSQVAVIPGLLAAAAPGRGLMTFVAAVSLISVLAVQMILIRRQHAGLWHALQEHADRLDQVFRESRDAILQVDADGRVEFVNQAVAHVIGYQPGALLGRLGSALVHPGDRARLLAELRRLEAGQLPGIRVSGRFLHGDGSWRHLESTVSRRAADAGYTLSVRDISDRERLEAELRRLAATDALTGLLNRQAFMTMLGQRLPRGPANVMFIDLDGFKAVNDDCGHAAGDLLLRHVAEALEDELRPGDIAARLGGDEFGVLPAVRSTDGALALAARLVERLARMPAHDGHRIGASIGIAVGHDLTPEALLSRADSAMYAAKSAGGSRYRVFEPSVPHVLVGEPGHRPSRRPQ